MTLTDNSRNAIFEHNHENKRDLTNLTNVLVIHTNKFNHKFDLKNDTLIKRETNLDPTRRSQYKV